MLACANCERPSKFTVLARVDDGADRNPGAREGQCGRVRAIVVGEHDGTAPGSHGMTVDIGPCRAREQGAGKIVAGVGDATLVRAACQHHRPGANFPHPLPRHVRERRREMVGDAFA